MTMRVLTSIAVKKTCVCVWILASFFEEQRHGDKETYINTERGNKIAKHGK